MEGQDKGITVEVALQYTNDYHSTLLTFANNIHTYEGGTHETGFKTALTRVINDYARRSGALKDSDDPLSGDDVREGLTAVSFGQTSWIRSLKARPRPNWGTGCPHRWLIVPSPITSINFLWNIRLTASSLLTRPCFASKARLVAKRAREVTRKKSGLEISNLAREVS